VVTLEQLWQTPVRLNSESTVMSVLGRKNGFDSFVDLIDARTGKGTGAMRIPDGVTHLSIPLKQDHNVGVISNCGFATFDLKANQMKSLIPYTRYWLSQHPELTSREVFLRDDDSYSERRNLREDFNFSYDFFGTSFYVFTGNISEKSGECLLVDRGRLSLWNLTNGDLLWVGYGTDATPISAVFSPDGNLAAVINESTVQVINFTSLIKRMQPAED
jgi:DNA-binding beta-propeller fold protein YncE